MKKYLLMISFFAIALVAATLFAPEARLQTSDVQQVSPRSDAQPAHEDYMSAAETVEVKNEGSTGDVVVAGANVKISGQVSGYVMAAGANVSVDAPVGNDLWAAGANVNLNAPIADNVMLAGSSVSLQQTAVIGGNAKIVGSNINILGNVTKDLNVAGAKVDLASEVGGNADIRAEKVILEPGAIFGEMAVFELDAEGRVARLKVGENYAEPVRASA